VEVVRPDLALAAGRRDAEQLAGADAVHPGAHADHSVFVVPRASMISSTTKRKSLKTLLSPSIRVLAPARPGSWPGPSGMSSQSSVMTASSSSAWPLAAS
jgi:hypothetical protein